MGWQTRALCLPPEASCLFRHSRGVVHGQAVVFDVPASVSVLRLLSNHGCYRGAKFRPAVTGALLRELHVDISAWDIRSVSTAPCVQVPPLLAACPGMSCALRCAHSGQHLL